MVVHTQASTARYMSTAPKKLSPSKHLHQFRCAQSRRVMSEEVQVCYNHDSKESACHHQDRILHPQKPPTAPQVHNAFKKHGLLTDSYNRCTLVLLRNKDSNTYFTTRPYDIECPVHHQGTSLREGLWTSTNLETIDRGQQYGRVSQAPAYSMLPHCTIPDNV